MNLDIEHVLFWMDAIRNSNDRYRTLESFWKGQIHSKIWLINNIIPYVSSDSNKIVIHGGWNGVLASLLFQSDIGIDKLVSIDINPDCEQISNTMNELEEISGKFKSITCNMIDYDYEFPPDIVINTSCEHISQDTYDIWLNKIPNDSLIVLQSNDYDIPEHIRIANNIDEFIEQSNIHVIWQGSLQLSLYTRWMLIGNKIV